MERVLLKLKLLCIICSRRFSSCSRAWFTTTTMPRSFGNDVWNHQQNLRSPRTRQREDSNIQVLDKEHLKKVDLLLLLLWLFHWKRGSCSGVMRAQVALLIQSTRIWYSSLIDADFGESLCTQHFHVATGLLLLFFSLDVPVVYMLPLLCVLCPFYVTTV